MQAPNVNDFWLAINNNNDDEAMAILRREALPNKDGTPSPRVAELIKNFDWDSRQLLSLVCVTAGACGAPVANDTQRFCGKYACVTVKHEKGKVTMPPGWYISAGSSTNGLFRTPSLPLREYGGPIDNKGATMLTDGDSPFRLNRAQWVFLMEGWEPSSEDPSEAPLNTDTPSSNEGTSWVIEEIKDDDSESLPPLIVEKPTPAPLTIQVPEPASKTAIEQLQEDMVYMQHHIRMAHTRIKDLESTLCNTQEKSQEKSEYLEKELHTAQGKVETMQGEVVRLTRHIMANPQGALAGGVVSDPAVIRRLDNLDLELLDDQGRFARLKASVSLLRERQETGGGVEINGVRFAARNAMLAWYEEREPIVGIFMDAHAMLHAIAPAVSSMTDTMRFLESQKRIEQTTGLESAVTTSFNTIVPSVFMGSGKNAEGGVFAALKASMKDYQAWKPTHSQTSGVSKRIKDGVVKVDERITMMRAEFTDSELIRVSNTLATDSMVFCTRLCSFLEEQQATYTEGTGYSASTVWDMQLECLQTILEELYNARMAVIDAARFRPGLLLWGMIQAWKVQKRYMSNNFSDDPALTGILVRRLIMQGDDKGSQNKKVEELQKLVNEHQRSNTAHFKKINDQLAKAK